MDQYIFEKKQDDLVIPYCAGSLGSTLSLGSGARAGEARGGSSSTGLP